MLKDVLNINNYFWNPWALPPLIGSLYFIFIGSLVFLKNPRSRLNIAFGLLSISSFLWQFGVAMMFMSKPGFYPQFWKITIGSGVAFLDGLFYLYAISLSTPSLREKILFLVFLLKSSFFWYLVISSDLILTHLRLHRFGYYLVAGRLHPLFLILFVLTLLICLATLYQKYKSTSVRLKKLQIRYIFLGCFFYSFACVDYIPMYLKVSLYPFGDIFVISFITTLGYAIIRYRAMEIETVIHRTLLWVLSLFLPILAMSVIYGLLKSSIFQSSLPVLVFLVSASLLIFLLYYNRWKPRIDQFFRRKKYDYQMVLAEMPARIGSSLDLRLLSQNLFKELREILYVRNMLLLVKSLNQESLEETDSAGYDRLIQQGLYKVKDNKIPMKDPLIEWLAIRQKALEKEQVEIDPQYLLIREKALAFFHENQLELLLPILMQDQLVSILGLGRKENLKPYYVKDIELLENIGRQIGITIDNALHHGDIVEKERIAEELRLGRKIQMSLLPQGSPKVLNLAIQGLMLPAREIGGDYYDFIPLAGGENYGIVIGDVSGKGVAAGLLMAMVKTAIHIFSATDRSPRETLLHINEILDKHISGDRFMTMIYLVWQATASTLIYSSAGQEYILIYRDSTGEIETIESGGILLGIRPDIGSFIQEDRIRLREKDKVLLYTDGVTEAQNQAKERFGIKRLQTLLKKNGEGSSMEIIKAIKDGLYGFMGDHPQVDDITLIVLEAMEKAGV